MKGKHWYQLLLDKRILKEENEEHDGYTQIKCKVELAHPLINWERSWKLARLPGLSSISITFLWQMLHNILPTRQRLNQVTRTVLSPVCNKCEQGVVDDLGHALLRCPYNKEVSDWMVRGLEWEHPVHEDNHILCLDVDVTGSAHSGLAFVWFLSNVLHYIFSCRKDGKPCRLYKIRAKLEFAVNILRKSRFKEACLDLEAMMAR